MVTGGKAGDQRTQSESVEKRGLGVVLNSSVGHARQVTGTSVRAASHRWLRAHWVVQRR